MNDPITNVLVINNVTLATAGRYICIAQFGNIKAEKDIYVSLHCKSDAMYVQCNLIALNTAMNETLSVNINTASEVSVAMGSNFSVLCEANINASISWFYNDQLIMVILFM